MFVSDFRHVCSFLRGLVYFTNKTDRHDITEILLKVALNTINLTLIVIYVVLCAFTISKTSFLGSSLTSHGSERQKTSTCKIIMIKRSTPIIVTRVKLSNKISTFSCKKGNNSDTENQNNKY